MSIIIPGTDIEVDHYKDRTWNHEVPTPHGGEYLIRIWRERLGFADPEETQVVYRERLDIPATKSGVGVYDAGKPERLEIKMADIVGAIGEARDLKAAVQAIDPAFDPATSMTLKDYPNIVVAAIELGCADCNEKRVLDLKLANADITQEDYDAAVGLLVVTREF